MSARKPKVPVRIGPGVEPPTVGPKGGAGNSGAAPVMSDRSNAQIIAEALREEGLDTGGFSPHSWRCEHPDRYPGYCTCVEDAVTHIVTALEAEGRLTQPITDAEVEAAARVLYEWGWSGSRTCDRDALAKYAYRNEARAALEAARQVGNAHPKNLNQREHPRKGCNE